jgi:insertion element IS1 protein InsB
VARGRAEELEGRRGLSSERDEMGRDGPSQAHPRWVGRAIDHHTGTVWAYGFGRRQGTVFWERTAWLEPCGLTRSGTDGWGAYERHGEAEPPTVGQANTPQSESKHLHLRTRMQRWVRRTLCFAKMARLHDVVIGRFINRYEFGVSV